MIALLLMNVLFQSELAPPIPTGSSPEFQATAYKVEKLIEEGKFDAAKSLLVTMAQPEIRLTWDDTNVPADLKGKYEAARDEAIAEWATAIPALKIKVGPNGRIKCSFTEKLPPPADSVRPAGAVFFTSDDPKDPRIEGVIALKRETPPSLIDPRHVQNEVGYAIGSYLGISKFPRPVGYMGRMDTLSKLQLRVHAREIQVANANIAFCQELDKAINTKTKLKVLRPEMFVEPTVLIGEPVRQGEPMNYSLQITNRGNATLKIQGYTDCGCVHVAAPEKIEPGQSGLVQVLVDTEALFGPFHKTFVLYSNDPEQSDRTIEIKSWVIPPYRLLRKEGAGSVVFDSDSQKSEYFLAIDQSKPFKVTGVKIHGLKAIAEAEPWEGDMADPGLGQKEMPRKGYKITVLASPTEHEGRVPMSFMISTDSKERPNLIETIYVQWGIVALPSQLNFGEVSLDRANASFIVSRPGKAFKVTGVSCESKFVTVTSEPFREGDFRVSVSILKTAPFGRLDANIVVSTDDPKQKTITVPLTAIIK